MSDDAIPYEATRQLRAGAGALLGVGTDESGAQGFAATVGEGHRIVVGPPGSGKFTSCIAPLLLLADSASVIVFDVKNGEAARETTRHRARLGPVLVLNPFNVPDIVSAGAINPLDLLQANDPLVLEKAAQLADAIFVVAKGGGDDFWNDQAREYLIALLLHVATSPYETDRTLKRVRKLIRLPWVSIPLFGQIWSEMKVNPICDGLVSDMAHNVTASLEVGDMAKTISSVQQTLSANTGFLDYPSMQQAMAKTTMDLSVLRKQVGTLYVCLPEEHIDTAKRWLRLMYIVIMNKVKTAAKGAVPLHLVMDEFPALGNFPRVQRDMNLVRSAGIHMHIVTQSVVQLHEHYGDSWESFAAASKFLHVLGANDVMTQEYVSKRLGMRDEDKKSKSVSTGRSGHGESRTTNTARVPVMEPAEVGMLPRHETLVIMEATETLRLQKVHYFDNATLRQRADLPPRSS